jgi:hypothetical protein
MSRMIQWGHRRLHPEFGTVYLLLRERLFSIISGHPAPTASCPLPGRSLGQGMTDIGAKRNGCSWPMNEPAAREGGVEGRVEAPLLHRD